MSTFACTLCNNDKIFCYMVVKMYTNITDEYIKYNKEGTSLE